MSLKETFHIKCLSSAHLHKLETNVIKVWTDPTSPGDADCSFLSEPLCVCPGHAGSGLGRLHGSAQVHAVHDPLRLR